MWGLTGKIDVWSARLPAALCGALAVLLAMDLARRTIGRDASILAGLIWVSTWFVVSEYRKAMADPYLGFFVLLTVWAWIAGDQARDRRTATLLILLAYAAAALAALAKGHLILVHGLLALVPYHLLLRRRPRFGRVHAVGGIAFLIVAAAWPVYIWRTVPNAWAIWKVDVVASEATSGQKFSPVYDYVVALPQTSAPWTVFLIVGMVMAVVGGALPEPPPLPSHPAISAAARVPGEGEKEINNRGALWALIWLLATIVLFSFLSMKKPTYLLPAMPAQTLLAAAGMAAAVRMITSGDRFLLKAHLVAAFIFLAALWYWPTARPLVVGLLIACGLAWFLVRTPNLGMRIAIVTALAFGACVHVIESWLSPVYLNRFSDAPFARAIDQRVGDEPLKFIGGGLREDVLFYLGGRTVPRVESMDQLPADYQGFAIVPADQVDRVRQSGRAEELSGSADRNPKDRMFFFRIGQPR